MVGWKVLLRISYGNSSLEKVKAMFIHKMAGKLGMSYIWNPKS